MLGVFFYFKENITINYWLSFFVLACLVLSLHYIKYLKSVHNPLIRFFLNTLLPIGLNFLIISTFMNNNDVIPLLVVLILIIPELMVRFAFTYLDHSITACPQGLH